MNENEKLNQDELRFSQIVSNGNSNNANSLTTESNSSTSVELSPSSKNVDLLDNDEKKSTNAFSLTRLNEQMVQNIVDQNNNEYFSTGSLII